MTKRRSTGLDLLPGLVQAAKGLAHATRLRILAMLASGELCVCQLTAVLELAPSTVSQHLSVLSHGGLVADRKEGRLVFYRLAEGERARELLPPLLALLEGDERVRADARVVERLRRVPVATLCAAELDLEAVGVAPASVGAGKVAAGTGGSSDAERARGGGAS